jgi:hypothetical protein
MCKELDDELYVKMLCYRWLANDWVYAHVHFNDSNRIESTIQSQDERFLISSIKLTE